MTKIVSQTRLVIAGKEVDMPSTITEYIECGSVVTVLMGSNDAEKLNNKIGIDSAGRNIWAFSRFSGDLLWKVQSVSALTGGVSMCAVPSVYHRLRAEDGKLFADHWIGCTVQIDPTDGSIKKTASNAIPI